MLNALLNPEAAAVIGASRKPGKVGDEMLLGLKGSGVAGSIMPVASIAAGETMQKLATAKPFAMHNSAFAARARNQAFRVRASGNLCYIERQNL